VLLLATQYPWLAAGIALAVLIVMLTTVIMIARRARRGWRRLRRRYFPDPRDDTG
jgi:heme exporter protein D